MCGVTLNAFVASCNACGINTISKNELKHKLRQQKIQDKFENLEDLEKDRKIRNGRKNAGQRLKSIQAAV